MAQAGRPRSASLAIGAASAIGILSTALFLPSFPEIQISLDTTEATVQANVAVYFVGMILAQLFYGMAPESIPRRPVLIAAMLSFALASVVGCMAPDTPASFLAVRAGQGLAAGLALVSARAISIEIDGGSRLLALTAVISLLMALAMTLGPLAGALVAWAATWQFVFAVLTTLALALAVLIVLSVPETVSSIPTDGVRSRGGLHDIRLFLSNPSEVQPALISALMLGASFAFLTAVPELAMSDLGVRPLVFAFYPLIANLGFFAVSIFLSRDGIAIDAQRWIGFALALCLGVSLLLCAFQAIGVMTPTLLLALSCGFLTGVGIVVTLAGAQALAAVPRRAASAAMSLGVIQLAGSLAGTSVVTALASMQLEPVLGLALVGLTATAVILYGAFLTLFRKTHADRPVPGTPQHRRP